MTEQPDWLVSACHLLFWIPADESSDSGSKWSFSLSGPEDVFGCWWKPYFPSLARCSQLATGSGNFLCSCALFFKKKKLPYSFLFTVYSPQTQKQMIYGRVISCRTGFVVFGTSVVDSFFIWLSFPRAPKMAPVIYNSIFSSSPDKMP